jgi:hypothetical protein
VTFTGLQPCNADVLNPLHRAWIRAVLPTRGPETPHGLAHFAYWAGFASNFVLQEFEQK